MARSGARRSCGHRVAERLQLLVGLLQLLRPLTPQAREVDVVRTRASNSRAENGLTR